MARVGEVVVAVLPRGGTYPRAAAEARDVAGPLHVP
jgi:hypothetical protein